jgi:hypothetical protein
MNGKKIIGLYKNPANRALLEKETSFLKNNPSVSERAYCKHNGIVEQPLCSCGKPLIFQKFDKGYFKTCGEEMCVKRTRTKNIANTMNEKYGGHTSTLPEVKKKIKSTLKEKYGDEKYVNTAKRAETMLERYGVEYPLQSNQILSKFLDSMTSEDGEYKNNREKSRSTCQERYGVDNVSLDADIRVKTLATFKLNVLDRINNNLWIQQQNKKVIDSKNNNYYVTCYNCNSSFIIKNGPFNESIRFGIDMCRVCNPKLTEWSSSAERELADVIEKMGVAVQRNYRGLGKEIDIYIPSVKLGVEFNGLYWHSEMWKNKNYHQNKKLFMQEKGVELIHVYEDEWSNKRDIVISMIRNKLGLNKRKIAARSCEIRDVSPKDAIKFLTENHIQGPVGSKYKFGLYLGDELVSLMTFGNLRRITNNKAQDGSFEMLRFCNLKGTTVIGGASRLFNYFVKKHKPNIVLSYANFDKSNGKMYSSLGFTGGKLGSPDYWYIVEERGVAKRVHRFAYRKDVLVKNGWNPKLTEREIMKRRMVLRLYDSGSLTFIWKRKILN